MKLLQEMMSIIKTRTDEAFIRPPDPYGVRYPSSYKGKIIFDLDVPEVTKANDVYPFMVKKDGVVDALKQMGIEVSIGNVDLKVQFSSTNTSGEKLKSAFEEVAADQDVEYDNLKVVK